jgi:hypothetical protein
VPLSSSRFSLLCLLTLRNNTIINTGTTATATVTAPVVSGLAKHQRSARSDILLANSCSTTLRIQKYEHQIPSRLHLKYPLPPINLISSTSCPCMDCPSICLLFLNPITHLGPCQESSTIYRSRSFAIFPHQRQNGKSYFSYEPQL